MPAPDELVSELKSLKIDRATKSRGIPGWLTGVIVAGVLVAVGFWAWDQIQTKVMTPVVDFTTVALVSATQAHQLLVATGYVVPQTKANISPRTGGRVAKILVEDGTEVKAGQLIAILEDSDYRAQLLQAQADRGGAEARLEKAKVDLEDAQRSFDREKVVQDKGVSTAQAQDAVVARLGNAKAQINVAKADIAAANARVKVAQVALDNCYVRAPFAGRITQKLTDVGEIVFGAVGGGSGGSGGVASLADFSTLMVEADVNESQVGKLKAGTPTEIALDAFPMRAFKGKVHEIRPKVDRAKATVTVKVAFVDDTDGVLPDMGAKVTFLAKELDADAAKAQPTPAVSADAIGAAGESKVLWVVDANGAVSSVPVVTGAPMGGLLSLKSGPPPGTKVVQRPPPELRAGMRVKEKQ